MRSERDSSAPWRLPALATLLLVSGACALVYQTAWLREFRLIFGGSTPATAAVLAVFMGGLGAGGAWFGRRVQASDNALDLYGRLELGIGITAALTPLLLGAARWLYLLTGGVLSLGATGAALAHLLLATLVLGLPCFLLGGTLPAATAWIASDADRQRGALGVIYGGNALGALIGVVVATFWSLEHLGTRITLWTAAGINLLIGITARQLARHPDALLRVATRARAATSATVPAPSTSFTQSSARAPHRFVYVASAVSGFSFFAAELVWYRMLTPLLGGTVYCFGIILALVLLGIAVGSGLYRAVLASVPGRVHLGTLAVLAVAQALCLALPWALGDRLAIASFHLIQWKALGFSAQMVGATLTAASLVLLPSILAGLYFPSLVALLGEGRAKAGEHVGYAYAANTLGSIAGSLCAGFWLLPALTAPGCWRLVIVLTLLLGFAALVIWERPWRPPVVLATLAIGGTAAWLTFLPQGPSASWRHASLGYGVVHALPTDPAGLEDRMRAHRREVEREWEGRESSIAVTRGDEGWALLSNGKADGSAMSDAGTQVMLGLIGALQHPNPKTAAVVGLGTGSTAGWMAEVPGMERVDVIELEPRVADAAREYFASVNRDALARTNLHLILGDAREVLIATRRKYDLIVSEPPNPYRAGVASLFTREYYQAVHRRLNPDGIFSQWLQGYQLSSQSLQLVYATLLSVFPHVETWITQEDDLVFVCHQQPPDYPLERIRTRLVHPVFAQALAVAWGVQTVEGVFARHLAAPSVAAITAKGAAALNTDDRNLLEYDMARTQLGGAAFHYEDLMSYAFEAREDLPAHLRGQLDREGVIEARVMFLASQGEIEDTPPGLSGDAQARAQAMVAWSRSRFSEVLQRWRGTPRDHAEALMLAVSASRAAPAAQATPLLDVVRPVWPADAAVGDAWVAYRDGDAPSAVAHASRAYQILRTRPWVRSPTVASFVELAMRLGDSDPAHAEALLKLWTEPVAAGLFQRSAAEIWYRLGEHLPAHRRFEVLEAIGTHHPWTRDFLQFRFGTLRELGSPLAASALRDLQTIVDQQGRRLQDVLAPPLTATSAPGGSTP